MDPNAVVSALVVDCHDAGALAAFWQELLGGQVVDFPEFGVVALRSAGVTFDFVGNGDVKRAKNRWHLDLATDDPDATIACAIAAGATRQGHESERFTALHDPEGNEFCVLRGTPAAAPWTPPPQ